MGKIYKVVLSKEEFKLPQKSNNHLANDIESKLNINIKKHESFEKMIEISKVINCPEIEVTDQNTNIFLLNLFLLLKNTKEQTIDKKLYNNTTLLQEIEQLTDEKLQGIEFNLLEKKVESYLIKMNGVQGEGTVEKKSALEKVEYSLDWLKKADKEINKRSGGN